jgi:fatty-acyl-CoA synthase/long-chain acyl-CoA synthetase
MYTGGTTGRPKGILHSAGSLGTNLLAHVLSGQIRYGEKMLLCTPLPHSAGFFLQAGLLQGATFHLAARFDPAEFLRHVEEHAISWTFMVPTMIYRLLDALRDHEWDTRSLETIVYGAAPISRARIEEALRRFGPVFLQLFGQSECPNFATTLSKEDHLDPDLLASCGQPCPGVEVRIGDGEGRALPTGEIGEVLLRAPYTLREYHAAPELTAQAFVADWLRTGDVGYQTETGHVFLVDRKKDMIITGGMNVYSSEVEQILHEHPRVDAAAVVGVPDPDWGEAVHAFLVSDQGLRDAELIEFCRSRLAKYKVPKALTRIEELPTTPYGKIDKKALRARWIRANTGGKG